MTMQFTKLHGAGNDFILIDESAAATPGAPADWALRAPELCDRHWGIGADGILLLLPSAIADVRMVVINPDGTEAEMCGNGIRCVARYWADAGRLVNGALAVETGAGVLHPEILEGRQIKVLMGRPRLARHEIPMQGPPADSVLNEPLQGLNLPITAVSMGNPHAVAFVQSMESMPFFEIGPLVESHAAFPNGANAGFAEIIAPNRVKLMVWERGAGPTMACGTGACAAVVAGVLTGRLERRSYVHLPGGTLEIEWTPEGDVYMTGPAEPVYSGALAPGGLP